MITRKLSLSENITAFCQHLRGHQFIIGPAEEADALVALAASGAFETMDRMRLCLQTILCKSPKQIEVFSGLYHSYWKELNKAVDSKIKEDEEENKGSKTGNKKPPSLQELKNWLYQGQTEGEGTVATYSADGGGEPLPSEAFSEVGTAELRKIIRLLLRRVARHPSRRFSHSKKKRTPDIRKSFRQSLKFGMDIFPLHFKSLKETEVRISVICDISRSMELYSRFLLQFMYAFKQEYSKIELFAFNTQLHQLTSFLEIDSLEKGISEIARSEINWGGGTKIGQSLDQFRQRHGSKMLRGKSIVIILSDGWDTGDIDLLGFNMRYMQRRCKQLIWINPLAGHPEWSAEVRGMEVALEYVDVFVPAFDVDSLRECFKRLRRKQGILKEG